MKNGTAFTKPGEGVTLAALADELEANGIPDPWGLPDDGRASKVGAERTALILLGSPLTEEDIRRIMEYA